MDRLEAAIKEGTEEYKLIGNIMVDGILTHIKEHKFTEVYQVEGYLHSLLDSINKG